MSRTNYGPSELMRGVKVPQIDREQERILFERHRAGDREATNTLMASVLPWISKIARSMARNREQLLEYEASICFHIARKIDLFDPQKARLTTWIGRVGPCFLIDIRRKMHRRTRLSQQSRFSLEFLEQCGEIRTQIDQSADDRIEVLYCCVGRMTSARAKEMILKILSGKQHNEVISEMGINKNRFYRMYREAVKELRDMMLSRM